mmetsp:Transcript_125880/g.280830  ORF Transcript_125880/g.280830 Transcript_125880/m.280830 type:complete len:262 (-) Transcript_125880:392-1177(-)
MHRRGRDRSSCRLWLVAWRGTSMSLRPSSARTTRPSPSTSPLCRTAWPCWRGALKLGSRSPRPWAGSLARTVAAALAIPALHAVPRGAQAPTVATMPRSGKSGRLLRSSRPRWSAVVPMEVGQCLATTSSCASSAPSRCKLRRPFMLPSKGACRRWERRRSLSMCAGLPIRKAARPPGVGSWLAGANVGGSWRGRLSEQSRRLRWIRPHSGDKPRSSSKSFSRVRSYGWRSGDARGRKRRRGSPRCSGAPSRSGRGRSATS